MNTRTKNIPTPKGSGYFWYWEPDSNNLNAARTSAAGDGRLAGGTYAGSEASRSPVTGTFHELVLLLCIYEGA